MVGYVRVSCVNFEISSLIFSMVSSKKKKRKKKKKKVSSKKKKKNGVFKKKKKKNKKNKWCLQKKKKKKKIWVGIQHARDYRAQGETCWGFGARACVFSVILRQWTWLVIYLFFICILFFVFCILYYFFLFLFFFLFENTIEKFRLLISQIYMQLTWNLPETYPKFTRNLSDHLA